MTTQTAPITLRITRSGAPDYSHAAGLLKQLGHHCLSFVNLTGVPETYCVRCMASAKIVLGQLTGLAIEERCDPSQRARRIRARHLHLWDR